METLTLSPEYIETVYNALSKTPTEYGSIRVSGSHAEMRAALYQLKAAGRVEITYGQGWHWA